MSTRDRILGSALKEKIVTLPVWGEVHIRELNGKGRGKFEKALLEKDPAAARIWTIIYGVVNEDGKLAFQEIDFQALAEKSGELLDSLANQILNLSEACADALEKAEQNLDETRSDSSSSI